MKRKYKECEVVYCRGVFVFTGTGAAPTLFSDEAGYVVFARAKDRDVLLLYPDDADHFVSEWLYFWDLCNNNFTRRYGTAFYFLSPEFPPVKCYIDEIGGVTFVYDDRIYFKMTFSEATDLVMFFRDVLGK